MKEGRDVGLLITLFEEEFNSVPEVREIAGGGSSRKYYRLMSGDVSAVGVVNEDMEENEIFIRLDHVLEKYDINVPHIIKVSDNKKCFLQEDLGDVSLFTLLRGEERMKLSRQALEQLVEFQTLPENEWDKMVGHPPFSERLVRWDLNYFKYDFLKPSGILFDEDKLEDDFDRLMESLLYQDMVNGLMYRDFQSRNIMWHNEKLWMIDFQGARKGPMAYDAVSYIWQAKAPFTFEEREELVAFYIQKLRERGIDPIAMERQIHLMEIFRTLQVLGAYGFRGLIERKPHFLESIPFGIRNLIYLKGKGRLAEYPEIEKIADRLAVKYLNVKEEDKNLTLTVYSFSYKKGYPEDPSGNGGGFMFDCRAIHNPGRYEEYKTLTGKDKEVIEFLDKEEGAKEFVENAVKIVTPSVERYVQRGFTSLQVGFGCTGGQHRSVYCAEFFSRIMSQKFPGIKVKLIHREQRHL